MLEIYAYFVGRSGFLSHCLQSSLCDMKIPFVGGAKTTMCNIILTKCCVKIKFKLTCMIYKQKLNVVFEVLNKSVFICPIIPYRLFVLYE